MPGKRKKTGKGSRSQSCIGSKKKCSEHIEVNSYFILYYAHTFSYIVYYINDSLEIIHQQLHRANLPNQWFFSFTSSDEIQCFEVVRQFSGNPPMSFSKVLLINQELNWKLFVQNHEITTSNSLLSCFPLRLTSKVLLNLLDVVQNANVCLGNYDDQFIKLAQMKKGVFYSTKNQLVAILEESFCFTLNKERRSGTVRHVSCVILLKEQTTCRTCINYCKTRRALVSKASKMPSTSTCSTRMNARYMKTPQWKSHLAALQRAIRNKNKQVQRLEKRLEQVLRSNSSVTLDDELSNDLQMIIDQYKVIEKDDFRRIFWEQQVFSMLCYGGYNYNMFY